MDVLTKSLLLKKDEKSRVRGYVLIQNFSLLPQKNGGQYIMGQLQAKSQLSFKVWSSTDPSSAFVTMVNNKEDYKNAICSIEGYIDKYGGVTSLVLESIKVVEEDSINLTASDFLEDVYDVNIWWKKLMSVLQKHLTEEDVEFFNTLVKPIYDRFVTEFAAVSHHDNCKSGLLAHTTKVVRMASLVSMYPEIMKRVPLDVLFIGSALHDIGKIYEYQDGVISDTGKKLSHNTFGVLFLSQNAEYIISTKGQNFYNDLLAIVTQHHGEWGERPRSVAAYVIHKLDDLESKFTVLNSLLSESQDTIQADGYKLT